MREVKFRGKRVDNGEWVYGNLIVDGRDSYIVGGVIESEGEYIAHEWWFKVICETVGQYTSINDKHGLEIFEGDIIRDSSNETFRIIHVEQADIGSNGGEYRNLVTGFVPAYLNGEIDDRGDCEIAYEDMIKGDVAVIRNIYFGDFDLLKQVTK